MFENVNRWKSRVDCLEGGHRKRRDGFLPFMHKLSTSVGKIGYAPYVCHMSLMVRIYDTDTFQQIAVKIYNQFEVLDSCNVTGFMIDIDGKKLKPKGELVLDEIKRLDELDNCYFSKSNGVRTNSQRKMRHYEYPKGSIGGPVAQKRFKWEMRMIDQEPRITIWRVQ